MCPMTAGQRFQERALRYVPLLIVVVVMIALELLADFHPFSGIWWTHKQAHDFGGLALIAVAIWLLARRD